jgi:hypothetical protein
VLLVVVLLEAAKRTAGAVKRGAETAGRAVGAAARGGASLAKRAATKTAAAAGEVAGAAKGGFEAGRIKAKREAMAKTKPQAKSSGDGDKTGGKLDSLLKDVRGGESKPAAKPAASGGSSLVVPPLLVLPLLVVEVDPMMALRPARGVF